MAEQRAELPVTQDSQGLGHLFFRHGVWFDTILLMILFNSESMAHVYSLHLRVSGAKSVTVQSIMATAYFTQEGCFTVPRSSSVAVWDKVKVSSHDPVFAVP